MTKLTILDLPLELINRIAIYSRNMNFCLEFAESYTIKKIYNKKIHDSVYLVDTNNINIIEILLKCRKLKNTQYLLSRAIHHNNIPIVKLLLEYGVDIEENGYEFLVCVTNNNHIDIIKLLVEYGVNPAANGNRSIQIASERNYIEIVRYFLGLNKRYRISTAPGHHYAFRVASERGYHELVELFLNPPKSYTKRVNIDAQLGYAVRLASKYGHEKVVQILINHGAILSHYDNLALRWAAEHNHLGVCKMLIDTMIENKNKQN
jgi:ankyrin repeat protein